MWYCRCFILVFLGINGGYTKWSKWSPECSTPCAYDEKQWQTRNCTNPRPEGNGLTCEEQGLGESSRRRKCSTSKCAIWEFFNIGLPVIVATVICLCVLLCCCWKRRQRRQSMARSLASREPSHHSVESMQRFPSSSSQQAGYSLEVSQMMHNQQCASHSQASGRLCLPNTTELHSPTGQPHERRIVEVPPLQSEEQPPPSYSREDPPPPYFREELSPPYSREEHPPPYSREDSPPPYFREPSPPYSREELSPPHLERRAFTTQV